MPPLCGENTLKLIFGLILSLISYSVSGMPISGRLLVPKYVSCERDYLTSWAGLITKLHHNTKLTSLTIETNDATTEKLTIHHRDNKELMAHFYLNGLAMTAIDWRNISDRTGVLIRPTRATIWVCLDENTKPLINWQPTKP